MGLAATIKSHRWSALGAGLAVLCGCLLGWAPLGEPWVNASYDYLFRFGSPAVTNKVTVILMDNAAFDQFHQSRTQPWNRALHARLLNRLADDRCPLVVLDSFFRAPGEPEADAALAAALRRQNNVVLMAEQSRVTHPTLVGVEPILPAASFLAAANTNWGVGWLDPDFDGFVRRHWPFPSPGPYPSLPWTAARLSGATLSGVPQARWLRYYTAGTAWTSLSYAYALTQPKGFYSDQIVFVGTAPKTSIPDGADDKFLPASARWTGEATGGVEILATEFLNLMNGDSLRRTPVWVEVLLLSLDGIALGGGLCRMRLLHALAAAGGLALLVSLGAILWGYHAHVWFPWMVIVGGQVPCALAWTVALHFHRAPVPVAPGPEQPPEIPGYKLFHPPIGEGAYGKVWLARNKAGQWRAVKVIYLAKFLGNPAPYERELAGVRKYQPISSRHPGLLQVDYVSKDKNGSFHYAMELGDSLRAGWEQDPTLYQPRDLVRERQKLPGCRLPLVDCLRAGIALSEALEFLHQQGVTHRDIKPQNIIYVRGQPKLADLGLITDIRPPEEVRTLVGTPGFMPPPPERPGTPQADIYALGMLLFVISTGRAPTFFPAIATTLVSDDSCLDFLPLNDIILKACQPMPADRYASAQAMHDALQELLRAMDTRNL